MEHFTRISRALGISLWLWSMTAFGAFVPGSLDTNYVATAPADGWLVVWSNGVPVWSINVGAGTNGGVWAISSRTIQPSSATNADLVLVNLTNGISVIDPHGSGEVDVQQSDI